MQPLYIEINSSNGDMDDYHTKGKFQLADQNGGIAQRHLT
jgi:hypothetical protein